MASSCLHKLVNVPPYVSSIQRDPRSSGTSPRPGAESRIAPVRGNLLVTAHDSLAKSPWSSSERRTLIALPRWCQRLGSFSRRIRRSDPLESDHRIGRNRLQPGCDLVKIRRDFSDLNRRSVVAGPTPRSRPRPPITTRWERSRIRMVPLVPYLTR